MKYKGKHVLAALALVLALLSLISPLVIERTREFAYRRFDPNVIQPTALAHIRSKGVTPELDEVLAKDPKPKEWKFTYVTPGPHVMDLPWYPGTREEPTIVAATLPELIGRSPSDVGRELGTFYSNGASASAPDGKVYIVWTAGTPNLVPVETATKTSFVVWALTWLTLAAWIYLDARERRMTNAPAWLLLGLLAGPLALAVWLIYRYTQDREGPKACPGCGAETVKGAAFCVRCGFALRPACPSCRKPVEYDWAHCAACGTNLTT